MPVPMRTLIYGRLLLLVAAIVALGLVIGRHTAVSWNVVLAVMGFSAVVFIHECGHFFVAKAVGIKVEVFSIFVPPILLGIRRTEAGYRVRILPRFFRTEDDSEGDHRTAPPREALQRSPPRRDLARNRRRTGGDCGRHP